MTKNIQPTNPNTTAKATEETRTTERKTLGKMHPRKSARKTSSTRLH